MKSSSFNKYSIGDTVKAEENLLVEISEVPIKIGGHYTVRYSKQVNGKTVTVIANYPENLLQPFKS